MKTTTAEKLPDTTAEKLPNTAAADLDTRKGSGLEGLEGLDEELESGLDDVDPKDIRLDTVGWNRRGVDPAGNPINANVFVNSGDESQHSQIDCVFLVMRKTHRWSNYDGERTNTVCGSDDRITGRLYQDVQGIGTEGLERPCKGCPQRVWRTVDGARRQDCAEVYHMIAMDLHTQRPFVVRFKKTSAGPIRKHLQRHHYNRMPPGSKVAHVPLFVYPVRLSLTMDKGGLFAHVNIERGERFEPERLREMNEAARGARDYAETVFASHDEEPSAEDMPPEMQSPGDTSFAPESWE